MKTKVKTLGIYCILGVLTLFSAGWLGCLQLCKYLDEGFVDAMYKPLAPSTNSPRPQTTPSISLTCCEYHLRLMELAISDPISLPEFGFELIPARIFLLRLGFTRFRIREDQRILILEDARSFLIGFTKKDFKYDVPKWRECLASIKNQLERFNKVTISLQVDGALTLFILLSKDGSVNRLGDNADDCDDQNMYIGMTKEPIFSEFMNFVGPAILAYEGNFDIVEKKGKLFDLHILFGVKDSEKSEGFQFRYGSDSQGPPQEILKLVDLSIQMTNSWHAEQKNKATSNNQLTE